MTTRGRYLWLQTIGGGRGDEIDPAAIPPSAMEAARDTIEGALLAGPDGAPLPQRLGVRLRITAAQRRLILTLLGRNREPIITMAVAPRDRDGAKLWPLMLDAAQAQGQSVAFPRPREPWALVLAHPGLLDFARADDMAWLSILEAEIGCAWLGMLDAAKS